MPNAQEQLDMRALELATQANDKAARALQEIEKHEERCREQHKEYKADRQLMMSSIQDSFKSVNNRLNTASYLLILTLLGMVGFLFKQTQGW